MRKKVNCTRAKRGWHVEHRVTGPLSSILSSAGIRVLSKIRVCRKEFATLLPASYFISVLLRTFKELWETCSRMSAANKSGPRAETPVQWYLPTSHRYLLPCSELVNTGN